MFDSSQLLAVSQQASEFPVTGVITAVAIVAICYLVLAGIRDIRRTRRSHREDSQSG